MDGGVGAGGVCEALCVWGCYEGVRACPGDRV